MNDHCRDGVALELMLLSYSEWECWVKIYGSAASRCRKRYVLACLRLILMQTVPKKASFQKRSLPSVASCGGGTPAARIRDESARKNAPTLVHVQRGRRVRFCLSRVHCTQSEIRARTKGLPSLISTVLLPFTCTCFRRIYFVRAMVSLLSFSFHWPAMLSLQSPATTAASLLSLGFCCPSVNNADKLQYKEVLASDTDCFQKSFLLASMLAGAQILFQLHYVLAQLPHALHARFVALAARCLSADPFLHSTI